MGLAKKLLIGLAKMAVAYSLCIFYSAATAIAILYNYWTKYETKFWIPKSHDVKPKSLSGTEFGKHAFITVNVSLPQKKKITNICSMTKARVFFFFGKIRNYILPSHSY